MAPGTTTGQLREQCCVAKAASKCFTPWHVHVGFEELLFHILPPCSRSRKCFIMAATHVIWGKQSIIHRCTHTHSSASYFFSKSEQKCFHILLPSPYYKQQFNYCCVRSRLLFMAGLCSSYGQWISPACSKLCRSLLLSCFELLTPLLFPGLFAFPSFLPFLHTKITPTTLQLLGWDLPRRLCLFLSYLMLYFNMIIWQEVAPERVSNCFRCVVSPAVWLKSCGRWSQQREVQVL